MSNHYYSNLRSGLVIMLCSIEELLEFLIKPCLVILVKLTGTADHWVENLLCLFNVLLFNWLFRLIVRRRWFQSFKEFCRSLEKKIEEIKVCERTFRVFLKSFIEFTCCCFSVCRRNEIGFLHFLKHPRNIIISLLETLLDSMAQSEEFNNMGIDLSLLFVFIEWSSFLAEILFSVPFECIADFNLTVWISVRSQLILHSWSIKHSRSNSILLLQNTPSIFEGTDSV